MPDLPAPPPAPVATEASGTGRAGPGSSADADRHRACLDASSEILTLLLSFPDDVAIVTQHIVDHVHRLSAARIVTFVGPAELSEASFEVRLAAGTGSEQLVGRTFAKAGSFTGLAMETNAAQLGRAWEMFCHHTDLGLPEPLGSVIAVPLLGADGLQGALVASRLVGQPPFTSADLTLVEDFARQFSLALQLTDSRAAKAQLRFQEEREAVGRQLQDDVIQRLFSIGSTVLAYTGGEADGGKDWPQVLSAIDETIAQLRSALTAAPDPA